LGNQAITLGTPTGIGIAVEPCNSLSSSSNRPNSSVEGKLTASTRNIALIRLNSLLDESIRRFLIDEDPPKYPFRHTCKGVSKNLVFENVPYKLLYVIDHDNV
jgi:hypothetical protein